MIKSKSQKLREYARAEGISLSDYDKCTFSEMVRACIDSSDIKELQDEFGWELQAYPELFIQQVEYIVMDRCDFHKVDKDLYLISKY